MRLKFNGNKPPSKEILEDTLFAYIGDGDIYDANTSLKYFRADYKKQYKDFTITDDLIGELSNIFQKILKDILPILTQINDYTLNDFN